MVTVSRSGTSHTDGDLQRQQLPYVVPALNTKGCTSWHMQTCSAALARLVISCVILPHSSYPSACRHCC
jgi:hypothetical protein